MIKISVNGASGRMGQRIVYWISTYKECILNEGVDEAGSKNIGKQIEDIKITDKLISIPDCVIDFSSPNGTERALNFCIQNSIPIVIGTTGHSDAQLNNIKKASENIPVLIASNMSVGVNILLKFIGEISSSLGDDYNIEIIEKHHKYKKDAPSGTAISIANAICDSMKRNPEEALVYGRKGVVGERTPNEIGMHSVRAGDIVGEHTVIFSTEGETIEITHKASNRDTFAVGAVKAGIFLAKIKKPGLYNMNDVLGLN